MNATLPRSLLRLALLALAALLAAGCTETVAPTPLDNTKALAALKTTLDAWRKGESTDSLKPSIIAQDMEWQGGAKLVDYAIEGEGQKVDSNLRARVKLTLKGKDGKDATKTAQYLVTTSPAVTVFRAFP